MINAQMKLQVGQILYRNYTNRYSKETEIVERTVSKIGKKYFEVKEEPRERFYIDTLKKDAGQYSQNGYQLYLTKQEIEDEIEYDKLMRLLQTYFGYHRSNATLDQLKAIAEILDLSVEQKETINP